MHLSSIPAIGYPSYSDLEHAVEQRLSRSIYCKDAQTRDTWLVHFFNYLTIYKQWDTYLTNDHTVTDKILSMYVCFLLNGFTIKNIKIKVGTIKSYLLVVNDHYKTQSRNPPFEYKSNSRTARLLAEQERYWDLPERCEPLPDKALARMMDSAKSSDPLGFKAAVWDITILVRFR